MKPSEVIQAEADALRRTIAADKLTRQQSRDMRYKLNMLESIARILRRKEEVEQR